MHVQANALRVEVAIISALGSFDGFGRQELLRRRRQRTQGLCGIGGVRTSVERILLSLVLHDVVPLSLRREKTVATAIGRMEIIAEGIGHGDFVVLVKEVTWKKRQLISCDK